MPLRQRLLVPVAALLVGGLLGLAPAAPAAAVGDDAAGAGVPSQRLLDRALAATAGETDRRQERGASRRAVPRRHDTVADPRGDVRNPFGQARGTVRHRHADILRATYRTPWRPGGDIVVTVRWAELRDGRSAGVRTQQQLTMLQHPGSGQIWFFWMGNAGGPVKLFASDPVTEETPRIVPRRLTVERVPGVGGRTVVRLSTEWLPVGRLRFHTFSQSRDAVDEVDPSLLLDVERR